MKSNHYLNCVKSVFLFFSLLSLYGCGALNTILEKQDLDVQTKASESIFLEPVSPSKRIIFISVRNTSDKTLLIKAKIRKRLTDSGFKITDDPELAQFMLQANILKVGKDSLEAADAYLEAGMTGATIGNIAMNNNSSAENVVIGALVGIIAESLVDDTLYTMVTDLQIRERPRRNESVTQQQTAEASQGSSTTVTQTSNSGAVNWKIYQTRIVSTANQMNLEFEDALPHLEHGLVKAISGFFAE